MPLQDLTPNSAPASAAWNVRWDDFMIIIAVALLVFGFGYYVLQHSGTKRMV